MRSDTAWLMEPITDRTTVAQLVEIVAAMPPEYVSAEIVANARFWKKADLRSLIKVRRDRYWDAQQVRDASGTTVAARRKPKRAARVPADLCEIPATDVNAWLRSLPKAP